MSHLTYSDKQKLEKLFEMDSGYVLNFSDRTFLEFFSDLGININEEKYFLDGSSKAKRLRAFWKIEEDFLVAAVLRALLNYATGLSNKNFELIQACEAIAERLTSSGADITGINGISNFNNMTLELLIEEMKSSLERGNPEATIDRLHTFTTNFIRDLCGKNNIEVHRDKPLHSLLGEYIKCLRDRNLLESSMAERILKSNISILEAFNDVRNNQSLAHDNSTLNKLESRFIFNSIVNTIKFLRSLEEI